MSKRRQIELDLKTLANPEKKKILQSFFKTGPGDYAEGDIFIGVTVPQQRRLIKKYLDLSLRDLQSLLDSPYHEARFSALLIIVAQFKSGDPASQKKLYELYLSNTARINNWDLVDTSAEHIVGAYLRTQARNPMAKLNHLASSKLLWDRRIAVVSTFHFIKNGEPNPTLNLAERLLDDEHDLMHKAVGWMLREVGKRCSLDDLLSFLDKFAMVMPRTMLRYAIERLPEKKRRHYMSR